MSTSNSMPSWARRRPLEAPASDAEIDRTIDTSSSTALTTARRNLRFVFNPNTSQHIPARRRTRALLRSVHYIGVFLFWRLVRYIRYAAIGAVAAALSATAVGSFVSGVGWVLAPPTMTASVGLGTLWIVGRWGFRKARERAEKAKKRDREQMQELDTTAFGRLYTYQRRETKFTELKEDMDK